MELENIIKLDFEEKNAQKRLSIDRVKFIAKMLRLKITDVESFRTANGIHIKLKTDQKMYPIFIVQVQTLMGTIIFE